MSLSYTQKKAQNGFPSLVCVHNSTKSNTRQCSILQHACTPPRSRSLAAAYLVPSSGPWLDLSRKCCLRCAASRQALPPLSRTSSSLIFVHLSSSFSRSSFALLSLPCYPRHRTHLNVGSSFDIFPSIMDFFRLILTGGLLCCAVGRRAELRARNGRPTTSDADDGSVTLTHWRLRPQ
jgi:hypothetical protein